MIQLIDGYIGKNVITAESGVIDDQYQGNRGVMFLEVVHQIDPSWSLEILG
nr:hypothetical protein [Marinoscillum furvescens]